MTYLNSNTTPVIDPKRKKTCHETPTLRYKLNQLSPGLLIALLMNCYRLV